MMISGTLSSFFGIGVGSGVGVGIGAAGGGAVFLRPDCECAEIAHSKTSVNDNAAVGRG